MAQFLGGLLGGMGAAGGGAALQASQQAMQIMDKTAAETTLMNAKAQSDKMKTDTINNIMNGYMDSANKATNAATKGGQGIQY